MMCVFVAVLGMTMLLLHRLQPSSKPVQFAG